MSRGLYAPSFKLAAYRARMVNVQGLIGLLLQFG